MSEQRTKPAVLRIREPYKCGDAETVTPIVIDYLGFEFECRAFLDSASQIKAHAQNIVNCINDAHKARPQ